MQTLCRDDLSVPSAMNGDPAPALGPRSKDQFYLPSLRQITMRAIDSQVAPGGCQASLPLVYAKHKPPIDARSIG